MFNPQGYLLLSSKDEVELTEEDHKTQMYISNLYLYAVQSEGLMMQNFI